METIVFEATSNEIIINSAPRSKNIEQVFYVLKDAGAIKNFKHIAYINDNNALCIFEYDKEVINEFKWFDIIKIFETESIKNIDKTLKLYLNNIGTPFINWIKDYIVNYLKNDKTYLTDEEVYELFSSDLDEDTLLSPDLLSYGDNPTEVGKITNKRIHAYLVEQCNKHNLFQEDVEIWVNDNIFNFMYYYMNNHSNPKDYTFLLDNDNEKIDYTLLLDYPLDRIYTDYKSIYLPLDEETYTQLLAYVFSSKPTSQKNLEELVEEFLSNNDISYEVNWSEPEDLFNIVVEEFENYAPSYY